MRSVRIGILLAGIVGVVTLGGTLSGSWSLTSQWDLSPFSIQSLDTTLTLTYSDGGVTNALTLLTNLSGLQNLYLDTSGAFGPIAFRSIMDFDAASPRFRTWLVSAATAIAGVNLYGLGMLDDTNPTGTPAIGSGLTMGGWTKNSSFSLWVEARFNMIETLSLIYRYGYRWLLDHFIFEQCDQWFKPSGYIDVQTAGTTWAFSGLSVYMETPFICCGNLLTMFSFSKAGFESVIFELTDLSLGLDWVNIKWIDVTFTTTTKSVNVVFDAPLVANACLTTYFALEGPLTGIGIEGISLKALSVACEWNGISLKFGHLFDEDGWYPYLNYPGVRIYGWTWEGDLATVPVCTVTQGYDEFIGLVVDGAACCGGSYKFSTFAWFDTGNSPGLFDWVETRVNLDLGIGTNIDLYWGLSITVTGKTMLRSGFTMRW